MNVMNSMLVFSIGAAMLITMLVLGSTMGESADKVKVQETGLKSDPDRPIISDTVPNPKQTNVNKVDALTSKMKVQEPRKTRSGKLRANTQPATKAKKSEGDRLGPRNLSH
jgi:hypothetical protein